jgi:hypothetical protein
VSDDRGATSSSFARSFRRLLDERSEPRLADGSMTVVLGLRGANHVVRLVDLSSSGAMVRFAGDAVDGEEVTVQLLDHGPVAGQVRWSRDGRIGIHFKTPINEQG